MSECKIDHTLEDVKAKLEAQRSYIPSEITVQLQRFMEKAHSQALLNEIFHLIKKYDLISDEERVSRNRQMMLILNNIKG